MRALASRSRWDVANSADAKTVKELKGHSGRINALAFSPKDGNLIVSASADKTGKLWDVNQGKSVRDFTGHGDALLSVNFSRDGSKLVTGSADKTARVWSVGDGKTLATLTGHAGPISSVYLTDDASRVATGSADQTVRFWDASTGRELQKLRVWRGGHGRCHSCRQQVGCLSGRRQRGSRVGAVGNQGIRWTSGTGRERGGFTEWFPHLHWIVRQIDQGIRRCHGQPCALVRATPVPSRLWL